MASNSTQAPFDPLNQEFFILGPDGKTPIPLTPTFVTSYYFDAASLSILYGFQLGACLMMLVVVLAMTPRIRFKRIPTIMNVLALVLNSIRMLFLAIYFTSTFLNFYVVITGDVRFVSRSDYNVSATATVLSIPITMLIEAALFVQAWSMLKLWPTLYKVPAALVSMALVVTTIGFNFAVTMIQTRYILFSIDPRPLVWARKLSLSLLTTSITWFCFLFNIRLVMHMWSNRSILPSLKGLKAMDVLVITNGILMFVPGMFPLESPLPLPENS
ncbi:hypothetical protein VTK56DRAFT_5868 [Thermocarpiscus australiensis]